MSLNTQTNLNIQATTKNDEYFVQQHKIGKNAYLYTPEALLKSLASSKEKGLNTEEIIKRQVYYGSNALPTPPKESMLSKLLAQFKDVMVLLLLFASLVSGLQGEWVETIVIIAILIINAVLGIVQEGKAEKALEALQKMSAPKARVLRNGNEQLIDAHELVPGDIVVIEAGDIVPADMRLLESSNLRAEEASLTGESVPVEKQAEVVGDEQQSLGDRAQMLYSSTFITYGRGLGLVSAIGQDTEMGKIAVQLQTIKQEVTPLQDSLEQLGKMLAILAIIVSAFIFLEGIYQDFPLILSGNWSSEVLVNITKSFKIAVSLAVAAVPEGLAAIVTIVLALGMKRMAERQAIVKRLLAVETLGSVDVICSDKTGTLTQNAMTVTHLYMDDSAYEVTGIGYDLVGELKQDDKVLSSLSEELKFLLNIGIYCNDAKLLFENEEINKKTLSSSNNKVSNILGDPTEAALLSVAGKVGLFRGKENKILDLPFDSERKMMTVFYETSEHLRLPAYDLIINKQEENTKSSQQVKEIDIQAIKALSLTKGAPDVIFDRCKYVYTSQGILPFSNELKEKWQQANLSYASTALRVLAFAFKVYDDKKYEHLKGLSNLAEDEMILLGLMGMIDPARPDAKDAITVCTKAGIRAVMITGDYKETAVVIARDLGLYKEGDRALTGNELDRMSDEELREVVEQTSVFARVSPEHKVRIVAALKHRGHIASMTGDGVNDAPALKQADIGVGMGITGTAVVKGAADMILLDDNFASIVQAVKEGRVIYSNIRKFVGFLLSCNVAEILVISITSFYFGFSPLESIQLLWLNLITDSFPALALGQEKADADIMEQKPRKRTDSIINKDMVGAIAVQSIAILFSVFTVFWLNFSNEASLPLAQTMAFTTLIMAELLRAYSSRSERFTIFEIGFWSNKTMVLATSLSFILLLFVIYIPFLNVIFHTIPLNLGNWLQVGILALVPFVAGELYKIVKRLTFKS